tara:strand:- start:12512 stop:12877 length:366 start_codon:yes stop_codon:yes gene_type:complete
MWYKKRLRYNPSKKKDEFYSIANKLKNQDKISKEFEIMLSNLTLEEIIGLRLELAAKSINNNLYGLKIWYDLPNITKDAVLKYVYSSTRTNGEAASFLGLSRVEFLQLIKKFNIKEYFKKT